MKKINIPIHKHTPKKYRQSMHKLWVNMFLPYDTGGERVTDLQRVPKTHTTLASLGTSKPLTYPVPEGYDVVPLPYGGFTFKKKLGFWRNLWQNNIRRKNGKES